jgi:hypothetical protein
VVKSSRPKATKQSRDDQIYVGDGARFDFTVVYGDPDPIILGIKAADGAGYCNSAMTLSEATMIAYKILDLVNSFSGEGDPQ